MAGRVLLTGASGFVGRQVVGPLQRAGWTVHAVGREGGDGAHWSRCDLLDAGARRALIAAVRPDAVLHCAWVATPGQYATTPANVDWAAATLGLVREALDAGTRRFLLVGSCAEYDWSAPPARPWHEDDPASPATLYGTAKHGTHLVAAALARQSGASLCWARLFHLLGPGDRAGRLVPDLMRSLQTGAPFATGAGHQVRDWLDVRDAGRALAALLDVGADGVVNVASGQGRTVASLVAAAALAAGTPGRVAEHGGGSGPAAIVADIRRLRRLTGFAPAIPLEQSLGEAWAALRPAPAPSDDPALPPEYHVAAKLFRRGDIAAAEQAARALLARNAADVPALNLLGVILRRLGNGRDAEAALAEAARLAPADAMPWINLGNVLLDGNEPERAAEAFHAAAEREPLSPSARRSLARALAQSNRLDEALAELAQALAASRDPAEQRALRAERARAFFTVGDSAAALAELDRAGPEADTAGAILRAQIMRLSGNGERALGLLRHCIGVSPTEPALHLALADALLAAEDRPGANAAYRRALELNPGDEAVTAKLCWSLLNSRYGSEADHLAEAGRLAHALIARGHLLPASAHAVQSVLLRLGDLDGLDAFEALFPDRKALLDWWVRRDTVGALHAELGRVRTLAERHTLVDCHRAWGERTERPLKPLRPARAPRQSRIRVGFMSSDLRNHPVAYFAEPIFRHYDRNALTLFAYSFHPGAPDAVQRDIAANVEAFRSMPGLPDEAIAAQIADDGLDVLFELGGSTHLNRLHVLAHQPAPIQVSWLGYPHSSGLSRIGHILVDPFILPPDPALLVERPLTMPTSWVTLGPLGFNARATIEDGLPEDRAGLLTFGTMNNPYKYTREAIALWAAAMRAVPSSRFLFVRPEAGVAEFRSNMARAFARHGIPADRLAFRAVRGNHLPHYNAIDIALDTAPQTGGTTTCECLWMGVPTVSLVGPAFFERLSLSTLSNAGLQDLAADSADGYVACAAALAADRPRRLKLRRTLRATLASSALGNNANWVAEFSDLITMVCRTS